MKRRAAVLSSGRQDWGILRTLCLELRSAADFDLLLLLGGMHLSAAHGRTRDDVVAEGFAAAGELAWLPDSGQEDPPVQASGALLGVAAALARLQPEFLVLVGDRFETAAAALAATLHRVPIVHLHGGEESTGSYDNQFRHSITKLSHLHLTSHANHAARVHAMGEHPSSIHVVGAPALDNLQRTDLPGRRDLEASLGMSLSPPVVLVTMHPATLALDPLHEARAVATAMDGIDATYVITLPNSDDAGTLQFRRVMERAAEGPRRRAFAALGEKRYWGLLRLADAMLGNSSSGLIEAPALALPVVNVGERQRGRLRGANVIDAPPDEEAVTAALRQALSPAFREGIRSAPSPYGSGHAARRILEILRRWSPPRRAIKPPLHV